MLTTNSLRTFAAADISSLFLTKINHLAKVFKPKSYLSLPISLGYERDLRKLIKFKFRFSIGTNILNMQTFLSESGPDSAQLNSHLAARSRCVFVGEQEYTITEKHEYLHKCSDVIHYEIENVAASRLPRPHRTLTYDKTSGRAISLSFTRFIFIFYSAIWEGSNE